MKEALLEYLNRNSTYLNHIIPSEFDPFCSGQRMIFFSPEFSIREVYIDTNSISLIRQVCVLNTMSISAKLKDISESNSKKKVKETRKEFDRKIVETTLISYGCINKNKRIYKKEI